MKTFLKLIGVIILLGVVAILVAGFFIPKEYHFEKSITIKAPKEIIWNNISTFSNFEKWDPWHSKDTLMQRTISGTDGTPGATYAWKGNSDVGSGTQTYLEIIPYNHVNIDLEFKEPFESKALVKYTLEPQGDAYKLTWGFDTKFSYPMNAVLNLFMDMDDNLNADFLLGLTNLKRICESNTTYSASANVSANKDVYQVSF